eukprot:GCRY01002900.1.p1 GENE.GCRY01002900.1~~GCRY01002900.1.p1  ORF type:complete len:471 (-),score=44.89 GCRY01002900.1:2316-3728(-)
MSTYATFMRIFKRCEELTEAFKNQYSEVPISSEAFVRLLFDQKGVSQTSGQFVSSILFKLKILPGHASYQEFKAFLTSLFTFLGEAEDVLFSNSFRFGEQLCEIRPPFCLPTLSPVTILKAQSTLDDFFRSYTFFHPNLPLAGAGFGPHHALLTAIESTIYAIDELNETMCAKNLMGLHQQPLSSIDYLEGAINSLTKALRPLATPLTALLHSHNIWDDAIAAEVESGIRYWALEQLFSEICRRKRLQKKKKSRNDRFHENASPEPLKSINDHSHACMLNYSSWRSLLANHVDSLHALSSPLLSTLSPPRTDPVLASSLNSSVSFADLIPLSLIHECISLKSFDYRILNLATYVLEEQREPPILSRETKTRDLSFMRASELFIEVGDDLVDYEKDVERNVFNIYRLYALKFGSNAPVRLSEFISNIEEEYERCLCTLPVALRTQYCERCESAMAETKGRCWVIPPPLPEF